MSDEADTRSDEPRPEETPVDEAAPPEPQADAPAPDDATAGEAATPDGEAAGEAAPPAADAGVAWRLLAVIVTLPWALLYGVTGTWAVTLGARSAASGMSHFDAGYTRLVTPAELIFVGALVLAAFAATLACALLLLFRRGGGAWLALFLVAAALTAGSVWAAVRGGLHPLLWVSLFFGIAYVTVVALVKVLQVTRAGRRARIGAP